MEIKKKKITLDEIFRKEQELMTSIREVCERKNLAFAGLDYEIDLEFGQKDNENQRIYDVFETESGKKYDSGYISRAMIKIKRKKTTEELAEDERLVAENRAMIAAAATEEEAEQLENDEKLRVSDAELKRSVAFTEVMLVRAYKSFWVEWICIGDGTKQLEDDLQEFYDVLEKKQNA
jgi:hypothetical protein